MHGFGPIGTLGAGTTSISLSSTGARVDWQPQDQLSVLSHTAPHPSTENGKTGREWGFIASPTYQTISYLNDQLLVLPWTAISR
jgi:hypothetical protein